MAANVRAFLILTFAEFWTCVNISRREKCIRNLQMSVNHHGLCILHIRFNKIPFCIMSASNCSQIYVTYNFCQFLHTLSGRIYKEFIPKPNVWVWMVGWVVGFIYLALWPPACILSHVKQLFSILLTSSCGMKSFQHPRYSYTRLVFCNISDTLIGKFAYWSLVGDWSTFSKNQQHH